MCECLLTDQAGIHRSVIVVGEGVEDAVAFEAQRLMNDALHHLKHLLITGLVASGSCTGGQMASRAQPRARTAQSTLGMSTSITVLGSN